MSVTVDDIIKIMETLAPTSLSEAWDNTGLQIGRRDWTVQRIWVSLDPLPDVVATAARKNIDLLITHHPLIFDPLKTIDFSTGIGTVIQLACRHRIAIFSAHTNLDSAKDGINDVLAHRLGMKWLHSLGEIENNDTCRLPAHENRPGIGRIGELEETVTLESLALMIKKKLGLNSVKIAGNPNLPIKKAAICAGSGSSLINRFLSSDAQVYISGDFRYHDARTAEASQRGLIDIGHFASEHLIVDVLAERLQKRLIESGIDIFIEGCGLEKDPFIFF